MTLARTTPRAAPGAGVVVSPGADRERLIRLADRMLAAVRPYASEGHARVTLPGPEGGYGRAVDGLEGFARTFLLAGFRIAGEQGADPHGYAQWYADGLGAGTDPHAPDRWVRLSEHAQAKVEAASIALVLDLTRPWIWDRLDAVVQERLVDYLAEAVGDDTYPRINWVWFRLVVQTFLRSVGGPHSLDEMAEDLATHDSFARADGWMADGRERAFDHYVGWALHLYPTLWARMAGAEDLAATRRERDVAMLDRYLQDAVALVGADGSPLVQGRSLAYRFAAAAPFWVGALAAVPSVSPGLLRRAATGIVGHFADRGAPDADDLLTLGWHHAWPAIAQSYSGPGSPYWASKGLLGLAFPADHPVWTAPAEPLPVERGDVLRTVRAAGWAVSGTRADGIVRVVNHGTDHALPGTPAGDSPLYARLGYSTATSPLLDPASWTDPADQSVVLHDAEGRATHRTGFRTLELPPAEGAVVLGSVADAHWLDADPFAPDHGSGRPGVARAAGTMTVVSAVRGAWEVRLVRVEDLEAGPDGGPAAHGLEITGWAVTGGGVEHGPPGDVRAGGLTSRVVPLIGGLRAGQRVHTDATPLGPCTAVPHAVLEPVPVGQWVAVAVGLWGEVSAQTAPEASRAGQLATVAWPDGTRSTITLPGTTRLSRGASTPSGPITTRRRARK